MSDRASFAAVLISLFALVPLALVLSASVIIAIIWLYPLLWVLIRLRRPKGRGPR